MIVVGKHFLPVLDFASGFELCKLIVKDVEVVWLPEDGSSATHLNVYVIALHSTAVKLHFLSFGTSFAASIVPHPLEWPKRVHPLHQLRRPERIFCTRATNTICSGSFLDYLLFLFQKPVIWSIFIYTLFHWTWQPLSSMILMKYLNWKPPRDWGSCLVKHSNCVVLENHCHFKYIERYEW